jgi:formate hydrogenlyase subunit 3/multisubunit Na+/H+ antiporter MnhD subunit
VSTEDRLVWGTLPRSLRSMGRWVTIVLAIGYGTSLVFVWHTTRLLPAGIADHYRGSESAQGEMQFPKSLAEMLTTVHTHLLTMALLFVVSGVGVALTERVTERWKRLRCVEPFVALLVSFGSMLLMRYIDARFAILLALSSALMALTFFLQCGLVLRELGWKDPP